MQIFLFTLLLSLTAVAQPSFKQRPIVYGISASYLSHGYPVKGLRAVLRRLPEIKALGANIIWLQPITTPFEEDGHGYDVIDYENVWNHLGSEEDLKTLVREAHRMNMGVMLDVVLNHSSFQHPFVRDIVQHGARSKFYHFYQHEPIHQIPYAQHFTKRQLGNTTFIHYFWPHLLNFNYGNPGLREYMFSTLEAWVKKYDIDGFRFDASWGPSTRWPAFYPTIARRLRRIKPHIILMAEDMVGYPTAYQGTGHPHLRNSGFDWAYDWDNHEPDYVSKWAFQLDGDTFERTVFNIYDPREASQAFLLAMRSSQQTQGLRPVRYVENNDTPGVLKHHTLEEAAWAAKILFLLPGVPLIWYGQEIGNKHDLFQLPSFDPRRSFRSYNPSLWRFYQALARFRASQDAISLGTMSRIVRLSPTRLRFDREYRGQRIAVELEFKTRQIFVNGKLF